MHNKGEVSRPTAKREAFEDDYVREGRNIGRGLEGGVDEELDYDANEDFQDDEDSNTFYFNKEEDEEKKLLEVRSHVPEVFLTFYRRSKRRSTAGPTPMSATARRLRTMETTTTMTCLPKSSIGRAGSCAR